jgi:hypothetical protein
MLHAFTARADDRSRVSQTTKTPPAETAAHSAQRGGLRSLLTALSTAAPVVVGVAFLVYAVRAGVPASSAVRAAAAVLITQILPGVLVWRCVRPRRGWWLEDVAMGFAIGVTLAITAQTLAGLTKLTWLAWGLGVAVAAVLVAVPLTRQRIVEAHTSTLPWWWAPAVSSMAFIAIEQLQDYHRQVPLNWSEGFRAPHVDAYLHLSLASQLAHRGPTTFPWVESEPLAYHWFSHAWVAQVSVVSGAGLDEVLMRFMPALMPLAAVLAVSTAAVRLSGRPWTGLVAALLTMAGGDLNVFDKGTPGLPITPLSPSLGLSVPVLIGLVMVLAFRWRGELQRGGLLLIPLLTFVAAGTKGSTVPLIVAGLAMAAMAMAIFDRTRLRMVLLDLGLVLACLILAVATVFRGSDAGLHLDPLGAAQATPAAFFLGGVDNWRVAAFASTIAVAAVLSRGAAVLGLLGTRNGRRDPITWLLTGAGLAGAGAIAVFAHPGSSQYYFARSAGPLLALASALGLAVLADRLGSGMRRVILIAVVAGAAVTLLPARLLGPLAQDSGAWHAMGMLALAAAVLAVAVVVAVLASSRRLPALATTLVLTILVAGVTVVVNGLLRSPPTPQPQPVAATAPLAVSRDQIDAARWIRDHSRVDDLVMTNRHCVSATPPVGCDSRRFVVAAFSERQVLVEGWTATPMATELAPDGRDSIVVDYWKSDLLTLNDGFIASPTEASMRELRDRGVRWVFVDFTRPHADTLEPWAELRFQSEWAEVYELVPDR